MRKVGLVKRRIVKISDEALSVLIRLCDWIADEGSPVVAISYIELLETYIQRFAWLRNVAVCAKILVLACVLQGSSIMSRSHSPSRTNG